MGLAGQDVCAGDYLCWFCSAGFLYFDQEEYAELLLKCIEDDFDYTIEKYGTVVPKKMPRPEIIWD